MAITPVVHLAQTEQQSYGKLAHGHDADSALADGEKPSRKLSDCQNATSRFPYGQHSVGNNVLPCVWAKPVGVVKQGHSKESPARGVLLEAPAVVVAEAPPGAFRQLLDFIFDLLGHEAPLVTS